MELKGNVELIEACLKTERDILASTVHNICTGTQYVVPHGVADILMMTLILVLSLGAVVMFAAMILSILRGY